MEEQEILIEQQFTLRDYLHILFKRKWVIVGITILVFLLVLLYTILMKPLYRVTGKVIVKTRASVLGSKEATRTIMQKISLLHSAYLTDVIEESMALAIEKAKQNGKNLSIELTPRKISRIRKGLKIRSGKSGLLYFTLSESSPIEIYYILSAILEVYVEKFKIVSIEGTNEYVKELKSQLKILKDKFDKAELEFRNFQKENQIFSVPDSLREFQKQMIGYENEKLSLKAKIEENITTIQKLEEELKVLGKSISFLKGNKYMQGLSDYKRNLQKMKTKLRGLLEVYTAKHPKVVELKKKIEEYEVKYSSATLKNLKRAKYLKYMNDPVAMSIVKKIYNLKMSIINSKIRINVVEALINKKKKEFDSLPAKNLEYARLERKLRIAERMYNDVLAKVQKAELLKETTQASAIVVQKPSFPYKPVKPNYKFNLTMAIIAGILIGVSFAFLIENLDPTIRTPEEGARNLKLKVLGLIPDININLKRDKNKTTITKGDFLHKNLITYHQPHSVPAESFRSLRTNIQFCAPDKEIKTIMITNSSQAKGKSTIIANLAISMAYTGKDILLVDTDLRKPFLHKMFKLNNNKGLTSIFQGADPDECIQSTEIEGLYLLPSGPIPPNPSELLSSPLMDQILDYLKEKYDTILFDSPPVVAVTDAAVLASKLDGILFMVCIKRVSKQQAKKGIELLNGVNARILGIVFNRVSERELGGYYYRYA